MLTPVALNRGEPKPGTRGAESDLFVYGKVLMNGLDKERGISAQL